MNQKASWCNFFHGLVRQHSLRASANHNRCAAAVAANATAATIVATNFESAWVFSLDQNTNFTCPRMLGMPLSRKFSSQILRRSTCRCRTYQKLRTLNRQRAKIGPISTHPRSYEEIFAACFPGYGSASLGPDCRHHPPQREGSHG